MISAAGARFPRGVSLSLLGLCPAGSQLSRYSRRSRAPSATINLLNMMTYLLPYTARKHHFLSRAVVDFSLNSKMPFHAFFSLVSSVTKSLLDGEGNGGDSGGYRACRDPGSAAEEAWPFVRRKAKPFPSPSIALTHRQSLGSSSYV